MDEMRICRGWVRREGGKEGRREGVVDLDEMGVVDLDGMGVVDLDGMGVGLGFFRVRVSKNSNTILYKLYYAPKLGILGMARRKVVYLL